MCKDADYKFTSLDDVTSNTDYLGDYGDTNWVSSGTAAEYKDQGVLLTMAPNTVGTLLMSAHYVWYGKVSATMTTSQGAGVVTAFILMSDVKDEIDFEWVGVDLESAQSNFYFQGITDYNNGENLTVSNTVENEHTYTIDWQPDQITWSIDGKVGRTLKKSDTFNETTKQYHYPQTPSRVQLSLWPAGLSRNGEGTIEWAGGLVDWDSPYMQNGYYYAMIKDISIECYDTPKNIQNNGNKVYYYTNTRGMEGDVATGNNDTELASFFATGNDRKKDPNKTSDDDKDDKSTTKSTSSATPETVPGMSGGGNQGLSGAPPSSGSGSGSGDGSTDDGSGQPSENGGGTTGSGSTSFSQGTPEQQTGGTSEASSVVAGSAIALLGFFAVALML